MSPTCNSVNGEDATKWLQENCTPEQLAEIEQFGLNIVGFETYIPALMADFANSIER